ncbi:MAG TPA: hypothetical protein VFV41_01140 [Streptosporangiaceae bacterium]|nr:hypothetical protein [Streptosporangiaceae bacterium]
MNPQLLAQTASEHVADLRRSAAKRQLASKAAAPRTTIRNRAGWTLVHIGLRLAAGSADA